MKTRRKQGVDRTIKRMVRIIVRRFNPERIILFGSHARGEAGPDSDVDLLIVMPVEGSKREKAVQLGVLLDRLKVPVDVIVTTPEEFAWRKEIPGTIERPAAMEGKVLYARTSQGGSARKSARSCREKRCEGESHNGPLVQGGHAAERSPGRTFVQPG